MIDSLSIPLWKSRNLWSDASYAEEIQVLMNRHQMSRRAAVLARLHGQTADTVANWISPEAMSFSDPDDFIEMEQSVVRIQAAIGCGERIVVVGDYDVDGVCASVILCDTLRRLNADWECIIPHRALDGYGLSASIVDRAHAAGANVLITVDNGIAAVEATAYAASLGIDVIVTDHHQPTKDECTAQAVIHWSRSRCTADSNLLSGAAVAWKLSEALLRRATAGAADGRDWCLGLTAMAALADIMPMVGENRKIVREGIRALQHWEGEGWLALCREAGVKPTTVTEETLLWNITPRINAAGRMDTAMLAFHLFLTADPKEAVDLAANLERLNQKRRLETNSATADALVRCQTDGTSNAPGLVVQGAWNVGIVGIVAAKLSEQLNRPTIVLADDGSGLLKGSGRAPDGFPLHEAVLACESLLHHFGGHDAAIGCALTKEHVEEFQSAFSEACAALCETVDSDGRVGLEFRASADEGGLADDWLALCEVDWTLWNTIQLFRPFGPEAPMFTFFVGPVILESVTVLSQGRHVRLTVRESDVIKELIWFNAPQAVVSSLNPSDCLGAVVVLGENTWRGKTSLQLQVRTLCKFDGPVLRREFGLVYRRLHQTPSVTLEDALAILPNRSLEDMDMILQTFVELGFAASNNGAYHKTERQVARDLRESVCYHDHLRQTVNRL